MRRADNLTTFMWRMSWNIGTSTSWNPLGLSRPVMGLLYLLHYQPVGLGIVHVLCFLCGRNWFACLCAWFRLVARRLFCLRPKIANHAPVSKQPVAVEFCTMLMIQVVCISLWWSSALWRRRRFIPSKRRESVALNLSFTCRLYPSGNIPGTHFC